MKKTDFSGVKYIFITSHDIWNQYKALVSHLKHSTNQFLWSWFCMVLSWSVPHLRMCSLSHPGVFIAAPLDLG